MCSGIVWLSTLLKNNSQDSSFPEFSKISQKARWLLGVSKYKFLSVIGTCRFWAVLLNTEDYLQLLSALLWMIAWIARETPVQHEAVAPYSGFCGNYSTGGCYRPFLECTSTQLHVHIKRVSPKTGWQSGRSGPLPPSPKWLCLNDS